MSHPTTLIKDTPYITEFRTYDPENPGQAKAPDSLPTATVYKNGTANGDSVTIALISTGLYKLTYNPAGEAEGDFFAIDINAVISSVNYPEIINFVVKAVERGTDSAYTGTPPTAVAIRQEIDTNSTKLDVTVGSRLAAASYTTPPTVGAIADAVWDEPNTDHEGGGTFGGYLAELGATIISISNRIGLFSGTGINTILGFLKSIMRSDASVPSDTGGTYTASTDSLEAQANALAALGNLGSGTYNITITVTDGTDPVPNAHVTLSAVGQTPRSGTTNGSGVCPAFSSDGSIDWTVTITAGGGLVYTPSTLSVVASNVTTTLEMSQTVINPPAAPNLATGILLCLGQDGLPEEGISIFFRLVKGPTDNGYAYDSEESEVVSGEDGIVSKDLVRGAYYTVRRGETGEPLRFLVPDEASFSIDEIFGAP